MLLKSKKLYTLPKQAKRMEQADQELWMRSYVIYPLIVFLALMDAATMYQLLFKLTRDAELVLYLLTFGISIALNFIPLVMGRYIHYLRYQMNGVRLWMIVGLGLVFLIFFSATFSLRWEMRDVILSGSSSGAEVSIGVVGANTDADDSVAAAYTRLMGIIPLVTSITNLALGYLISDPVKRKAANLRRQRAVLLEQIALMQAAELELDQDWYHSLEELERARLETAEASVRACSEQIRQMARLSLAEKLGDVESISELTGEK